MIINIYITRFQLGLNIVTVCSVSSLLTALNTYNGPLTWPFGLISFWIRPHH